MSMITALTIIFRHKYAVCATFLVVFGAVLAITLSQKEAYEARATLLVKMLQEDTSRPGITADNPNAALRLTPEEVISTEVQILGSQDLAERVVRPLGVERLYPELAAEPAPEKVPILSLATQAFSKDLKVVGVRKSNVISVAYRNRDPRMAAQAVNLLIDEFKEKHLALHSNPDSSFIDSQFASFQAKLRDSEKALQDYLKNNNISSIEEQRALLLKQRSEQNTAYLATCAAISELKNKVAIVRAQVRAVTRDDNRYTSSDRERIVVDAKAKLLDLQLKEQELRRKYTDSNKLVVETRKEIDVVNGFLKDQERGIAGKVKTGNPVYQSVELELFRAEAELTSQVAKARVLKDQLREIDREIAALEASDLKIQMLKREVAMNEKNFKTYAERQEEARLSEAMNRQKLSNIGVIQAASVPVKPVGQNKGVFLVVGTLLALGCGISCGFLLESLGQTFSTPESVEKYLQLPVLLTVTKKEGGIKICT